MSFLDKLADPAHPIWLHIKVVTITIVIAIIFQFGYKSGLVTADILPIIGMILTMYGVNVGQQVISKSINKTL